MSIDATHDPARRSWVASANGHPDFPIQNLPFGVFSSRGAGGGQAARGGMAIGDMILDLAAAAPLLEDEARAAAIAAGGDTLNALFALGAGPRVALRHGVAALLDEAGGPRASLLPHLHAAADCTMRLPARIGGYTDFFAGIFHAENAGRQFRPDSPLLPNYKHVPVAYHSRASSVVVSGTPVRRPNGQRKPANEAAPSFGPCRALDYELELGVWIGPGNRLGEAIPIAQAAAHIAGYCLLNDWSARDVQGWESQPLGPFLAKNFSTSISPWVVTPEALAPFRIPQSPRPDGDPAPLPYLLDAGDQEAGALDLRLEVSLVVAGAAAQPLSVGNARHLYWTPAQMVAHHTCGGCNLQPGDLLGTGTVSGPEPGSEGCLLEMTANGKLAVALAGGGERRFLEDGDTVVFHATARRTGYAPIGFGTCRGTVLPAPPTG